MNYIKITSTYSPVTTFYDSEMPYFPEIKDTFLWLYYSSENSTLDLCWWAESTDITTLRNTITSTKKKRKKKKGSLFGFQRVFRARGVTSSSSRWKTISIKSVLSSCILFVHHHKWWEFHKHTLFFPKKDKYLYGSIGQFIWYTNWDWWRVRCTPN